MSKGPKKVDDVLAEVFKRAGMKRKLRRAEAVLLWPQVAGSEVAKFTQARTLQDGILVVQVSDSETAMHFSLQRQRFLDVYRGKYGVKEVRDIRFLVGYKKQATAPSPTRVEPLPPDPRALANVARDIEALDLPESLTARAMQTAKSMLAYRAKRRAEGWRDCRTCETLTPDDGLCSTCARYADSQKVQAASRRLAVDPASDTPALGDDERRVAVYLARSYLHERLRELLPQVLADPAYKAHLESAARCYLAHCLGKPVDQVDEADMDRLEPRIARALGRWI